MTFTEAWNQIIICLTKHTVVSERNRREETEAKKNCRVVLKVKQGESE